MPSDMAQHLVRLELSATQLPEPHISHNTRTVTKTALDFGAKLLPCDKYF